MSFLKKLFCISKTDRETNELDHENYVEIKNMDQVRMEHKIHMENLKQKNIEIKKQEKFERRTMETNELNHENYVEIKDMNQVRTEHKIRMKNLKQRNIETKKEKEFERAQLEKQATDERNFLYNNALEQKKKLETNLRISIEKHKTLFNNLRRDELQNFTKILKKYFKTLRTKYNQCVYTDDYGRLIEDDFIKEWDYFFNNVFVDEINLGHKELTNSRNNLFMEFLKLKEFCEEQGRISLHQITIDKDIIHELALYDCEKLYSFHIVYKESGIKENELYLHFDTEDIEDDDYLDICDNDEAVINYIYRNIYNLCWSLFCHLNIVEDMQTEELNTNQDVAKKTPLEYEKYIANKLKEIGFDAKVTKGSGDQGVDILASKNNVSFAIQCKMYSNPVGNKAVQEVCAGREFYSKDYGVVVSNATFTKAARQLANKNQIILLNDTQLEILLDYV